jgi:hypothetical protein
MVIRKGVAIEAYCIHFRKKKQDNQYKGKVRISWIQVGNKAGVMSIPAEAESGENGR